MKQSDFSDIWHHQLLLDTEIDSLSDSSDRIYEHYIAASNEFQDAVINARKSLGLNAQINIEEGLITEWAVAHLGGDNTKSINHQVNLPALRKFHAIIDTALNEAGLDERWRFYMAVFIVNQTPPISRALYTEKHVEIVEILEGSIVVKLKKGIRYEEYVHAWKPLSKLLGKGRRKNKKRTQSTRDIQIYKDRHEHKMSYAELAQKYFGKDARYNVDAIKKALKRQETLFNRGTDLTK